MEKIYGLTEEFINLDDKCTENLGRNGKNFQYDENDNVNHPKHYQIEGLPVESFDIILALVNHNAKTPKEGAILKDIYKYTFRYGKKNGVEDLKKAKWYLDRLIFELGG